MKTTLLLSFLLFILACKKDNSPTFSGVWNQDSLQFKQYFDGVPAGLGTDRQKGVVWSFKNNGKLSIVSPTLRSGEFQYQLVGNDKLVIGIAAGWSQARDISWLNDSKVIMHHFDSIQPPTTEYWVYLSR